MPALLIHQELETSTENQNGQSKLKKILALRIFATASLRIDVGAIKLFANMDMNDLWKDK